MAPRQLLHDKLQAIMGEGMVYFQPPPNLQVVEPCIVYHRDNADTKFADNTSYRFTQRYTVIYIDRAPDREDILAEIASLPMCLYQRWYTANNLNHDAFVVYF
jgi:hypothetical protein